MRPGPYNSAEPLFTLADKVENPGVIQTLKLTSNGYLHIHLNQPIDPGLHHHIVFCLLGQYPRVIPAERITALTETVWQIDYDTSDLTQLIVSIGYEGYCLGTWWPDRIDSMLDFSHGRVPSADLLETTAALIRWMHVPILSDGYSKAVRAFIQQYSAETMAAWLLDDGLPDGLHFEVTGEEWISAMRRVFGGWRPTHDDARAIIETLSRDTLDLDRPLLASIPRLMRLDPLLMGRVVRVWLNDALVSKAHNIESVKTIDVLRRRVMGLSDTAPDSSLLQTQRQHLNQAATDMQVDANFLERGIVKRALNTFEGITLQPIDAANLNTALAVAPFREYLGVRVLGEIIK